MERFMKGWVPEGPADFGASSHAVGKARVVIKITERSGMKDMVLSWRAKILPAGKEKIMSWRRRHY